MRRDGVFTNCEKLRSGRRQSLSASDNIPAFAWRVSEDIHKCDSQESQSKCSSRTFMTLVLSVVAIHQTVQLLKGDVIWGSTHSIKFGMQSYARRKT
jgi:hypothetical protein